MMYIRSLKKETKHLPIQQIAAPPELYMPLKGYKGFMDPVVKEGETVKKHQLIASMQGLFAGALHAPVSGIIQGIYTINNEPHLKLVNDFKDDKISADPISIDQLDTTAILKILKDYGIEGSGGARFPTHLKYTLNDGTIDTFIINAAECEPYLSADYALINNEALSLLKAVAILQKVIKANCVVIAIEKQHKELIKVLKPVLANYSYPVTIKLLPNEYPQGGELQLIKSVTGKELPKGSIPSQHGIVVSNVGTLWAAYRAFYHNSPYTERVITISGEKASKKGNYLIKIGTPVGFIMNQLGNNWDITNQTVIMGGPMMGKATVNSLTAVHKGTGGIVVLLHPESNTYNCIQCGYCTDVCPQRLMPLEFARHENVKNKEKLLAFNIADCIECGACAYICPSDVPLMKSIFAAKEIVTAV